MVLDSGGGVGVPPVEHRVAYEVAHHENIAVVPEAEVLDVAGRTVEGEVTQVAIAPEGTAAANPAFDVTPGGRFPKGRGPLGAAGREGLHKLIVAVPSNDRHLPGLFQLPNRLYDTKLNLFYVAQSHGAGDFHFLFHHYAHAIGHVCKDPILHFIIRTLECRREIFRIYFP